MSDPSQTNSKAAPKSGKRRGFWRGCLRWTKRLAIVTVVLLVIGRVTLQFWLPSALNAAMQSAGMRSEYEDFDLSILGGDIELRHVDLYDAERAGDGDEIAAGVDPFVHLEFVRLDVDASGLLLLDLRVHRVEVDGIDIDLSRGADGVWQLPTTPPSDDPVAEAEPEPVPVEAEATDEEPSGWNLMSPVQLDAIRLQHVRVHLVDAVHTIDTTFETQVRISDVGHAERPARLSVQVVGDAVLDAVTVEGKVRSAATELELDLDCDLRGLHLSPCAGLLEEFGLRPVARSLDAELLLHVGLQSAEDHPELDAVLRVEDVGLTADGVTAASVGSVEAHAHIVPDFSSVTLARVSKVRAHAERRSNGAVRVAGLELVPATGSVDAASTPPSAVPPPSATPADAVDAEPRAAWGVDRLEVGDVEIAWEDAAVKPATILQPTLQSLVLENLGPGRDATLAVSGAVAPAIGSMAVDGTLGLELDGSVATHLEVALEDLSLVGLDPWLDGAGLRGVSSAAALGLQLDLTTAVSATGGTAIEAGVTKFAFLDGAEELFALDAVNASMALGDVTRVFSTEIAGLRLPLRLDDTGSLHVFGLRTLSRDERADRLGAPQPVEAAAPPAVAQAAPPPSAPQDAAVEAPSALFLDRVDLTNSSIRIVDGSRSDEEARELLFNLGLALRDVALFQDDERDATVELSLSCEKVGSLRATTAIHSRPGVLDLDLATDLAGDRLDLTHFEAFLVDSGLVPTLDDGRLRARVEATVVDDVDDMRATVRVAGFSLTDASGELVALDTLSVPQVAITHADGSVDVDRITVRGVRAAVKMDADGVLHAAGIAIPPAAPGAAAPAPASTPAPASAAAASNAPAGAEPVPGAGDPGAGDPGVPKPSRVRLAGVELGDVAVTWRDESPGAEEAPIETALRVRAEVGEVVLGGEVPKPIELDLHLAVDSVLEDLQVRGTVLPDPLRPRVAMKVSSRGLRGDGVLGRYLGPGQSFLLEDGRLAMQLNAAVDPAEDGGIAVVAKLEDISFRDGEAGDVLVGVKEVAVEAPRIDPDGGRVTVDRLVARGMRLLAVHRDGGWEVAGLRIEPPTPAEAARLEAEALAATAAAEAEAAANPPPEVPMDLRAGAAPLPPALVEVRQLEVEFEELIVHEAEGEPLVTTLSLASVEPLLLTGPEPEELPPWKLEIAAQSTAREAGSAMESMRVAIDARPWEFDPSVQVDVQLLGLRGAPLHAALPMATSTLDLGGIEGGSLRAALRARLDLRRRDPTDFDLSRGFGLEAEISNVEFRAVDGGPLLAGVESVFLEAPKLGGPVGNVHVTELSVQGISMRVDKREDGLHVLGLRIPDAASEDVEGGGDDVAATEETAVEDTATEDAAADDVAAASPDGVQPADSDPADSEPADAEPSPVTRVDRIDIHGLDFVVTDTTTDPALVLPLDELAITVEGFRAGGEDPPPVTRFEVLLGTSDIELPVRSKASSALAGFLSAAANAAAGSDDAMKFEERPLLGELLIKGEIAPSNPPRGTVNVDLSRLELLGLRGPAKAAGVEISDGVFDANIGVNLEESGATQTDVKLTFADLGLNEPPGGPISTYLKLPAPLQTVLFVLKNSDDEIIAPLSVSTDADGGVSGAAIAGSAVAALGSIISDAIASSALRVGGAVTGLFGIGGPSELPPEANVLLEFAPGSADLPADAAVQLATLLEVLGDEELEVVALPVLGEDDLERAAVLANPDTHDRFALVERLRSKKRRLWRSRDAAAGELQARAALGASPAVDVLRVRVREIESELAITEQALDRVLGLLRPGADKSADRRARRLALQLADARAEALVQFFERAGGEELAARLQIRRARFPEGDEPFPTGFFALSPRKVGQ